MNGRKSVVNVSCADFDIPEEFDESSPLDQESKIEKIKAFQEYKKILKNFNKEYL